LINDHWQKTAGLLSATTIEEYDFSFNPQLDQAEVMDLSDLSFIGGKVPVTTQEAYLFFHFVSYTHRY
jgi:hypothetical protein